MRYWVASRTGEIGIRVALGAPRGAVLRLVVGHSAGAAAAGVLMGLAGAIAVCGMAELRAGLGMSGGASVLVINTEGNAHE